MALLTQYVNFYVSPSGEKSATDDLNAFLRSLRIINVEKRLIDGECGTGWVFLVEYGTAATESRNSPNASSPRMDYREVLNPVEYALYDILRSLRKELAEKSGVLVYAVFTNDQLAGMDHHVLEKLPPRAYCRYMDDFVAWSSSKKQLKDMFAQVSDYVGDNLKLELKPPVFGDTDSGLPFLGFLVKENGVYLMQKSKRRVRDRMAEISVSLGRGETTQEQAAERIRSVFAVIGMARTYRFRKKLCEKWGAAAGDNRVICGGSWNNTPDNARSAIRNNNNPDNRNNNLGFRVVRP